MYNEMIANYDIAIRNYKQKNYEEAKEILLELYKKDKKSKYILFQLGRIEAQLGNKEVAKKYFRKCIKYYPHNIYPRFELGKIYSEKGDYKAAEKQFLKYIELDKDKNPHGRLELGKLRRKQGRYKEAEKEMLKSIKIQGTVDALKLLELSKIYRDQGRYEEAEVQLRRAIKVEPQNPSLILNLAKIHIQQSKYEEAEKELKECIKINNSQNPYEIMELAKLYGIQEKNEEAVKTYSYILDNLDEDFFDIDSRVRHVKKHLTDNFNKDIHGVFTKDINEILNIAIENKCEKQTDNIYDVYCFNVPKCGYEGGRKGDGHILNYFTLITLKDTEKIVTMFPSDKIELRKREIIQEKSIDEER